MKQVKGLDLLSFEKQTLKELLEKNGSKYPRTIDQMTSFSIWMYLISCGLVRPVDKAQFKSGQYTAGQKYQWDIEKMKKFIAEEGEVFAE